MNIKTASLTNNYHAKFRQNVANEEYVLSTPFQVSNLLLIAAQ